MVGVVDGVVVDGVVGMYVSGGVTNVLGYCSVGDGDGVSVLLWLSVVLLLWLYVSVLTMVVLHVLLTLMLVCMVLVVVTNASVGVVLVYA